MTEETERSPGLQLPRGTSYTKCLDGLPQVRPGTNLTTVRPIVNVF